MSATSTTIRILGIDPGTRNVGYGVVELSGNSLVFLDCGCIRAKGDSMADRLVLIHHGLQSVIQRHRPQAAAVETVFIGTNSKTAIAIGEGRGVAVLSAAENGLSVQGYEPALVKRAVAGNGRADKDQVRSMVRVLLSLPSLPETDHEADALALAITHARHSAALERAGTLPAGLRGHARTARRKALPECVLRQLPPGFLERAAGKRSF